MSCNTATHCRGYESNPWTKGAELLFNLSSKPYFAHRSTYKRVSKLRSPLKMMNYIRRSRSELIVAVMTQEKLDFRSSSIYMSRLVVYPLYHTGFLLNRGEFLNILYILLTFDTFHLEMSPLNLESSNIEPISSTLRTFQPEISPLNLDL